MSDELLLKACDTYSANIVSGPQSAMRAVIALIRAEVLEEAASVVALMPRAYDKIKQDHDVLGMKGTWTFTLNNGPIECAAAIRALKDAK